MNARRRLLGLALGPVLGWLGCGGSGMTPTPVSIPDDRASLLVAIPPPNATPSSNPAFAWAANFTVNVAEQSGFSVDLSSITVELQPPVVFDETLIKLGAQSSHVAARGTLSIRLSMAFQDPAINARVVVRGTDETGTAIEGFGQLVVIPAQRP